VDERDLGCVYISRFAFRISKRDGPEPDVAFLHKDRRHLVRREYVDWAPDLVMEVVSPDSIERDYHKKREQYRNGGVREYWIVDEIARRVTLLRLTADGAFRTVRPRQGVLHSEALPGFWLKPGWLWKNPLPKAAAVLAEILGA
jgi:Uma2 family endonuclease